MTLVVLPNSEGNEGEELLVTLEMAKAVMP